MADSFAVGDIADNHRVGSAHLGWAYLGLRLSSHHWNSRLLVLAMQTFFLSDALRIYSGSEPSVPGARNCRLSGVQRFRFAIHPCDSRGTGWLDDRCGLDLRLLPKG